MASKGRAEDNGDWISRVDKLTNLGGKYVEVGHSEIAGESDWLFSITSMIYEAQNCSSVKIFMSTDSILISPNSFATVRAIQILTNPSSS